MCSPSHRPAAITAEALQPAAPFLPPQSNQEVQTRSHCFSPSRALGVHVSSCCHLWGVPRGKCAVVLWAALVGPEKKYTFQEGLLVVNWAQIHNQSLVAIPRGASHTALQRVLAELPPSARLPPAQRPCEGGAETYPHQSQLHSCIFICILNDQSKQFYHDSNQSGQCHFVQTVQIWNLHLHKIGLIRKEGGNFL